MFMHTLGLECGYSIVLVQKTHCGYSKVCSMHVIKIDYLHARFLEVQQ